MKSLFYQTLQGELASSMPGDKSLLDGRSGGVRFGVTPIDQRQALADPIRALSMVAALIRNFFSEKFSCVLNAIP